MKFLIDECLHTSLVHVAQELGYEASHVTWRGFAGAADWDLMTRIIAEDLTFVTNNARDFRRLFGREELHSGLVIVVPQVPPVRQRALFGLALEDLIAEGGLLNEVLEVGIDGEDAVITRYGLPA